MRTIHFELFWIVAFLLLASALAIDTWRRKELSIPALCAVAGGSIFWQEFYADWGAYLLWNPNFHMMPWHSPLTTPAKPWFNLLAYPVFMCTAFTAMLALTRKVSARNSGKHLLLVAIVTAGPILFLLNFATEIVSVATLGLWTYTETYGPAFRTDAGTMPLLYPGIPFAMFGAVMCWLIESRDTSGRPKFERLMAPVSATISVRELGRCASWAIAFNLAYWFLLCAPLIVARLLIGAPSIAVP